MAFPQIKIDWTINPTVVLSAIIFLFSAIGSWYNLREEVHVLKAASETHFIALDTAVSDVKKDIGYLRAEVVANYPPPPSKFNRAEVTPDPRLR